MVVADWVKGSGSSHTFFWWSHVVVGWIAFFGVRMLGVVVSRCGVGGLFSFCILTLCQFKKRLEKRKSKQWSPKTQIFGVPHQTPPLNDFNQLPDDIFFFTKTKFHQPPGEKKIEIGALVSGSEMSKFGS